MPLVSIITVVYNGEAYLEQTINSVLNQTYENIEYIIIDGGSGDGTIEIIKKYEKHLALWITEPDKGLYDAMNKGIKLGNGELVGIINSDDWYELNAVELIVNAFHENPFKKIFHGDRFDVLTDGSKRLCRFNSSKYKFLYCGMTYNHPSMFFHRDIYENNNYNYRLKAFSDYEFVLKQFLKNESTFHYVPTAYVNYRLDGISANMSFKSRIKEGYCCRQNAGLSTVKNLISVATRVLILLKNKFQKILLFNKRTERKM